MPLDSTSTLDEIEAAYADNASYQETGDVTKAKAFVTACRLLLLKLPKLISQGGNQIALSPDLIRKEMTQAQLFVSANGGSSSGGGTGASQAVRHGSFENFPRC